MCIGRELRPKVITCCLRMVSGIRKAKEMTYKVMIFGDFNFPEIDWANHIVRAEGRPRQEEARGFMLT